MNASVSPSQLTVGDPATVRLTIQGQGGIERLELGTWPEDPAFRVYPGTNGFMPADELGLTGVKTMEFVLVPERPGKLKIPVPPLVFFDPETRRYDQATVDDLTLDVRPAVVRSGPGAATNAAGGSPGSGTNTSALAGSVPLAHDTRRRPSCAAGLGGQSVGGCCRRSALGCVGWDLHCQRGAPSSAFASGRTCA
jgi:hypothetical protein